jgi:hypothetical protein
MRQDECNEPDGCEKPIHLFGGVGDNYIFAFHFNGAPDLESFLRNNLWDDEKIARLNSTHEVTCGNEWARLETENL